MSNLDNICKQSLASRILSKLKFRRTSGLTILIELPVILRVKFFSFFREGVSGSFAPVALKIILFENPMQQVAFMESKRKLKCANFHKK